MIYNSTGVEIPDPDWKKMQDILKESDCPYESLTFTLGDKYDFAVQGESIIVKAKEGEDQK
jgi:hypothetical protein